MGSLRNVDSAPEQRSLLHRITGAMKKALCPQGIPAGEIEDLFVAVPGVGIRLNPSGRVVVVERSAANPPAPHAAAAAAR